MIFPSANADIGDVELCDFEDANAGTTYGTSGLMTYSGDGSSDKNTTSYQQVTNTWGGTKSYYMHTNVGNVYAYLNFTQPYVADIYDVSFDFKVSGCNFCFYAQNSTGNDIFEVGGSSSYDIYFHDVSSGDVVIAKAIENINYTLRVQSLGTNEARYSLYYDDNDTLVAYKDGAIDTSIDWQKPSRFVLRVGGSGAWNNIYFDNINVNPQGEELSEYPEVTGTAIFMNGQSGLHDTDLNVNNYFNVHLTGDAGRKAKVFIKDPSDTTVYYTVWTYPLIPLPIYDYSLYFSKIFTTVGTYNFTITDFYDSANTWSSTFDVVLGGNDYEGTYGNTSAWAEFIRTGADCEYRVGDYFDIVCYLPYDATNNTDSDYYKLFFFALGTNQNGTMEDYNAGGYRGSTLVHYANNLQFLNDVCEINNFGQWRIEVWSCETDNTGKAELNASSMIYVCNVNVSTQNSYEILLDPNYAEYNRNGTMTVTIRKTGDTLGSYFIKSPYASYIEIKTLYNETETITLDFSTYNDSHLGTWYIKAYDFSGSPSDWNARSKEFKLVSTPDAVEPSTPIFPSLSAPLGAIVGMIIVVACIILPLLIGGQFQTEVPVFAYALSGGIGIVVSTIFGFFPSWVIFFLVAIGLIAVFLMWIIGRQNGGT
jgi:hypothetical protein